MFLSKIWFFLVALGAAIALTIALVMPRPAQRQLETEETARLTTACSVIDIWLADAARDRVAFSATFARAPEGVGALDAKLGEPATTNSVVAADINVQPGKITDVTLRHRAATLTLKLVNKAGGEALANTSFTVLTPGGDVIRELIGAFPSLVLAEGEYVAIARHDAKTYQGEFQVQSAFDHDIEIIAK